MSRNIGFDSDIDKVFGEAGQLRNYCFPKLHTLQNLGWFNVLIIDLQCRWGLGYRLNFD